MKNSAKLKKNRSPSTEGGRLRKRSHRYPEDDRRLRGDGGGGSHGPVAGAMAQAMAGHGGHAGHGAPTKKGGDRGGRPPKHQMTQKQMSFLQGKHQQRVGNVVSRLGPAAVGQASLMDKKRKLYSDTSQQPLWSLRKITINPTDKDDLRRFPSNAISTYRYTPMTFLVKNLWEQFHRVINWWFLLIAIIQAIPQLHYNPNHVWSTALPLSIVLVFGMVKDILTDIGRRRRDRLLNQRICCIVDGHTPQLRLLKWQSVHVGNILRLTDGEEVPADIVVLATSNADGVAYVETSKLDGETNLKFKQGVKETRGESSPLSIAGIRGRVVCEKPSAVMDAFTGSLKLDAHPRATPLDIVNFIQRGSHIRNTEWLYGVVIYTGEDTRIQKNAAPPGFKRPHIEKDINTYLFISFFVVFLTILISVMSKWSVQERDGGDNTSSDTSNSSGSGPPVADSAQTYGSSVEFMLGSRDLLQNPWTSILRFLALYAPLLPLSLPFVLDVIYLLQSILIQGDVHIRGGGRLGSSNGPSTGSTSSLTAPEEGGQDGETPEYLPHLSRSVMSRGVSLTKRLISRISSPGLQTASAVGGSSDPVSDPLAGGEQTTAAGQGGSNGESPTSPQQLTGSDTLPRRGTTPPPRGATGGSRSTESDAPSKHSRAVSDASTMHEGEPQPGLAANSVPSQPRLLPQHGAGDDVEPPGGGIVWMPTTGSNVTCFGAKRRTETEDVWPEVHCPALNPNLGQVDFVFTDKTGTITENDMTFSMCSVAGKIYGMTTYGGYDPGESSEYAGSASRGWTRQISSRGSRDRLLNAQQSQQTLSRGGTSLSSRSISLLSEGLAKRVPSLRMRKSPTHVQDDDEKGSTSVSATGSSSPSKPESFGAMASLSAESRPEKKPDASPDNHSPHNSAEGAVELPAAPTAKVATEAVHGAPLRQMMSGLARRGTSPRGEQPSAGSRTRKGSPAEDERRAERRPKDSSEDTSTKKKKKKKRKKLEVSDESSTGPISCIRSISDGYKREGPPRRTSTSDSEVPVFSSPISAQFSFPGVAQPGGEEEREPSPTQSSRPHITFADGVPTSLPESPVGGVSPRESSFGPTTSVPDTSGLPASSRVSPRHLGGDLGTSEGSLYMPAVEEEEEDDGFFGGGPAVPSGRGGDVPFLYDDIDFPTGFRETPMEGQIRKNCDFYDSSIFTDLSRRDWRSHRINEFIKCMAICNTVVPWVYSTTPSGYEGAGSSAAVSSLFSASSIAQCTSFAGLPGGECAGEGDHTGFAKHHPHGVLVHKSSGGQHGGTIGSGGAPTASAVSGFALCRASSRRRTRITRQEGAASVAGANGPWHVSTGQLETGGGGPSYIPSPRAHSPRGDGTTNSPADRPPAVASPTGGGEDGSSPTAPAPALPPSVLRGQQGAAGGGLRPAKSLARGVSFKEKHEEFSFSKDEDTMTQDDEAAGSGEEQESEQDEEGGGEHKRSGGGRDEEDDAEDGGKGGRPGIKGRKCRSTSVSLMSLKTKVTASSRDVADLLFRRSSRNHGTDSVGSLSNHITRSLGRTHSIDRTTSHSCYGLNGSSMGGGDYRDLSILSSTKHHRRTRSALFRQLLTWATRLLAEPAIV